MHRTLRAVLLLLLLASPLQAFSRRNAVVQAVEKTRAGIVAIKVEKRGPDGESREANGTGVLIDERGYIVTSDHVVAGAKRIVITLAGGQEYVVEGMKRVEASDLAILKIEAKKPLPFLTLGPSGDLLVGEDVVVVGHPLGYRHSVATGVISALGREIVMPSGAVLKDMVQTSASVNPGNSGGPLLNINGELIGIVAAMRDNAQAITFAIPADTVKQVLAQSLSARRLAGLSHGLNCQERILDETGDRQRVVVRTVSDESPAAGAGLRAGDTILQVGDRAVANRFDVERALWDRRVGETVRLKVQRAGKALDVALKLR